MQRKQLEKKAILKIVKLFALIISAIVLVRFTPPKEFLTAESLSRCLQTMGIWAPIAFIVVYVLKVCLFISGIRRHLPNEWRWVSLKGLNMLSFL